MFICKILDYFGVGKHGYFSKFPSECGIVEDIAPTIESAYKFESIEAIKAVFDFCELNLHEYVIEVVE